MGSFIYEIQGFEARPAWASLDDFVLGAAVEAEASLVVSGGNWSLYGLDKANGNALFVELAAQTDLSEAVFIFDDQKVGAQRLLTVPLAELEALAAQMEAPKKVILVFSIGRCGSTLVSNVLNEVPNVWSLSEPYAFAQLILESHVAQERQGFERAQVVRLIRAMVRLIHRQPEGKNADVLALKFHSQTLFQADIYYEALPEAAFVFLYREVFGWASSFYLLARKFGVPATLAGDARTSIWNALSSVSDPKDFWPYVSGEVIDTEVSFVPVWAHCMASYSAYLDAGVPFMALDYDEMNADRRGHCAGCLSIVSCR